MQKLMLILVLCFFFSFSTSFAQTEESVENTMSQIPLVDGYVVPDAIMDSLILYADLGVDYPIAVLNYKEYIDYISNIHDEEMSLVETKIFSEMQQKMDKFELAIVGFNFILTVKNKTVKVIAEPIDKINPFYLEIDPKKIYDKLSGIHLGAYNDNEVEIITAIIDNILYVLIRNDSEDVTYVISPDGNFEKEILDLD